MKAFYTQKFSGEDRKSETYAYMQADLLAAEHINENRDKAMSIYDEIDKTIKTKDLGSGNFECTFSYSFERTATPLDSFTKPVTYNGGFRAKAENAEFPLSGTSTTFTLNVKVPTLSTEYPATLGNNARMCLPDGTYADESTYGTMIKVNKIEVIEDGESGSYFSLNFTLNADESHMAKIKSNAGNWHALVPVTLDDSQDKTEFIIYIPIKVTDGEA